MGKTIEEAPAVFYRREQKVLLLADKPEIGQETAERLGPAI